MNPTNIAPQTKAPSNLLHPIQKNVKTKDNFFPITLKHIKAKNTSRDLLRGA